MNIQYVSRQKMDQNYLKKLEAFFKECQENGVFPFIAELNSAIDLFKTLLAIKLIFLGKFITLLHNPKSSEGLYKAV